MPPAGMGALPTPVSHGIQGGHLHGVPCPPPRPAASRTATFTGCPAHSHVPQRPGQPPSWGALPTPVSRSVQDGHVHGVPCPPCILWHPGQPPCEWAAGGRLFCPQSSHGRVGCSSGGRGAGAVGGTGTEVRGRQQPGCGQGHCPEPVLSAGRTALKGMSCDPGPSALTCKASALGIRAFHPGSLSGTCVLFDHFLEHPLLDFIFLE